MARPVRWTGVYDEIWSHIDRSDTQVLPNVRNPTLAAHVPEPGTANGTSIILCPGGAWHCLAYKHERTDLAEWFCARGVTAFILKYRLIQTGDDYRSEQRQTIDDRSVMEGKMATLRPLILADGQQAVRLVREQADRWQIDPDRIGMMGFSAGGHVALNVALQHDPTCRPDFVAAIYTAGWDDIDVPGDGPPLFALCAADDAMAEANRPVSFVEASRITSRVTHLRSRRPRLPSAPQ
jgi:acetyl esterase/lipase